MKNLTKRFGAILIMTCMVFAFMPLLGGSDSYAKSKAKLNKKTLYMVNGSTYKLKVKGKKGKVKWSSSDNTVATVSSKGKVKAKGIGTCVITAKVKSKQLKCNVTVETKAQHNARALRSYILSKGKKSGKTYTISTSISSKDNEGTKEKYSITASKSNMALVFKHSYSTTEPPEATSATMTIDLISNTGSVQKGTYEFVLNDGYSEYGVNIYDAEVTTQFHNGLDTSEASVTGMTLTKYGCYSDSGEVEEEITDQTTLNTGDKYTRASAYGLSNSFPKWNKLMNKYKTLKKKKINMKSIGFSNF